MSAKSYNVLEILDEKTIENVKYFFVVWDDKTTDWVKENDISKITIENYYSIKQENAKIQQISQSKGIFNQNKEAFVYCRTSSKSNNPYEQSIDTQKSICFKYCEGNNIKIKYLGQDEGVSGRFQNNLKHELGFFSKYLEPNKHVLVVYTPDRIGRNSGKCINFLNQLSVKNIDVVFVKENIIYNKNMESHHRNTVQLMFVQAENYSNMASERIKNTISEMKKKGHYIGSAPIGWKIFKDNNGIRKMKKNNQEQEIIKFILKEYKKLKLQNSNTPKTRIYKMVENELVNKQYKIRNKQIKSTTIQRLIKKEINQDISNVMNSMYINNE